MVNMMIIYNNYLKPIGILSNQGLEPMSPFFDDKFVQELDTGADTLEFRTFNNNYTSNKLKVGNYVGFRFQGKVKLFQILETIDVHDGEKKEIEVYGETVGLELLNDYSDTFTIEGNAKLFFNTILADTRWRLRYISSTLENNIQKIEYKEMKSVYTIIQENLETFGGLEIEFSVGYSGNMITGFYIDVYANGERGRLTEKRFTFNESMKLLQRKYSFEKFCTAVVAEGKKGVTIKDVEWKKSEGKPVNKPAGSMYLVDDNANQLYNRNGNYIVGKYSNNECESKETLCEEAWDYLQENKEPHVTYECDVALVTEQYEDLYIGDTNYIIDYGWVPRIYLSCRVSVLEISFTNPSKNKVTFSNFKELTSRITRPKDGETPEIGDNGNWWIGGEDTGKPSQGPAAKYVIVNGEQIYKYANGFSGTPTPSIITISSSIIGVVNPSRIWSYKTPSMSNYVNMSSTDANIVIMHNDVIWGGSKSVTLRCSVGDKYDEITLVKVADGSQGIQGNGVKSTQEEFYLSSDKVNQPSEADPNWTATCPQWQPGKYIWTRIKMTYTNNNVEYVGYSVDTSWEAVNDLQIGGINILVSNKLTTYTPYNSIESATTGTDKFVSKWNPSYTGNVFTLKNNNSTPLNGIHTFSGFIKVNGEIPSSPYFKSISTYYGYALENYYDSTTGYFRLVQGQGGTSYWTIHAQTTRAGGSSDIVEITKMKLEEGNKATAYDKAPEDVDNAIGNNVANVDVMFYLSTSNISLAGGEWKTTAPPWEDGKYMWQKTVTTLGNGQTTETAPTCIAGAKGDSGYTIVLSNENHAFPCQSNGNIASAITTTTRVVAFKGAKEITPTIGTLPTIPGLTLTKSGATITIVASTGTSLADSGTFDIPITIDGIDFTKTFTWSKSKAGATGPQGNPGTDGKIGQGIESVDIEYAKSMKVDTPPKTGWSTVIPTYEKGYFLWQRTKVVYKDPAKTAYTTPIVDTIWGEIDSIYSSISTVDGRLSLLIGNSTDESNLTLSPKMITLLSENLVLSGKNIEINGDTKITGLVTANENFKINSDGSITCKKAEITGALTATGNIVLYDNPKGFRGKDTKGNEVTLAHVGMDDCSRFGWGSWERMSSEAYNMGCEYLGGKRAILRSKEQTYLVCNGGTYDAVGGSAIVFLMNSAGDYALRPVAPNKDYLGTGTYYWAGVSSKEFNNTSDRNLKENVKYISNAENIDINSNISALDCYDFMNNDLPVALYNYIDDIRTKIGVIAQDIVYNADKTNNKVGQLIVNVVPYTEDTVGEKLTYDMNNFIGVIAAAQQVNIKKTETHNERLNKIEKRLELLENGK